MNIPSFFSIIFGTIFVLVLPGVFWSYVFLSHSKSIDVLERWVSIIAFSIVFLSLAVFSLNNFGVNFSAKMTFMAAFSLFLSGAAVFLVKKKLKVFSVSRRKIGCG